MWKLKGEGKREMDARPTRSSCRSDQRNTLRLFIWEVLSNPSWRSFWKCAEKPFWKQQEKVTHP